MKPYPNYNEQLAPAWWIIALLMVALIFGILCGAFALSYHDGRIMWLLLPFCAMLILVMILKYKRWS